MPAQTLALTRSLENLPHLTVNSRKVSGKIRQSPEDFQVDEVPAYLPSGTGPHLFVRFRKTGLDTPVAAGRIAAALDVPRERVGWAGLKDRHAVTTQWASFEGALPQQLDGVRLDGVEILETGLHNNKLKTGHLHGNRFRLCIRDTPSDALAQLAPMLDAITRRGLPNYYGEQRFGRDGGNLERALSWITGTSRPPRDRFARKLHVSTVQSALFNDWLGARLDGGTFDRIVRGDLVRKEDTGGMFVADDVDEAQRRFDNWELSPTGPMFGAKMRWPEHESMTLERATLERAGLSMDTLDGLKREGPGSRRAARVRVGDIQMSQDSTGVVMTFTLPAGSYATVLLRELFSEPRTEETSDPAPIE